MRMCIMNKTANEQDLVACSRDSDQYFRVGQQRMQDVVRMK